MCCGFGLVHRGLCAFMLLSCASTQPDIVRALMQRVEEISHQNYHPPVNNPPIDLDGYCAAVNANDNFVGPWMRVQSEFVE